jgi:uncharacterized protein YkwD
MPKARILLRLVALVLAAAMVLGTATPAPAKLSDRERNLAKLVNKARANHSRPALDLSAKISMKARAQSRKMAQQGHLSHSCLQCRFQGWNWHGLAENVAKARTVPKAHQAFMHSGGHRANILGSYKKLGTGVVKTGGWLWVTEIFYR